MTPHRSVLRGVTQQPNGIEGFRSCKFAPGAHCGGLTGKTVRISTGSPTLRQRLRQHRGPASGRGNHRGSIFRLLIGHVSNTMMSGLVMLLCSPKRVLGQHPGQRFEISCSEPARAAFQCFPRENAAFPVGDANQVQMEERRFSFQMPATCSPGCPRGGCLRVCCGPLQHCRWKTVGCKALFCDVHHIACATATLV
jgi:hypothetical protein